MLFIVMTQSDIRRSSVVPRRDSNLRSRLRRPKDLVIARVAERPTWAFCSRPVSSETSRVLSFAPRDIPRRVSSLDEFEALVLGEVGWSLMVNVASGRSPGEAAGGDPGVVDRSRTSAEPGMGLDFAPDGGGLEAARQDDDAGEEDPQAGPAL
jgi:hypothetical protein